eukprot:6174614-Pleurochrysis_carterae.AAC.3
MSRTRICRVPRTQDELLGTSRESVRLRTFVLVPQMCRCARACACVRAPACVRVNARPRLCGTSTASSLLIARTRRFILPESVLVYRSTNVCVSSDHLKRKGNQEQLRGDAKEDATIQFGRSSKLGQIQSALSFNETPNV